MEGRWTKTDSVFVSENWGVSATALLYVGLLNALPDEGSIIDLQQGFAFVCLFWDTEEVIQQWLMQFSQLRDLRHLFTRLYTL